MGLLLLMGGNIPRRRSWVHYLVPVTGRCRSPLGLIQLAQVEDPVDDGLGEVGERFDDVPPPRVALGRNRTLCAAWCAAARKLPRFSRGIWGVGLRFNSPRLHFRACRTDRHGVANPSICWGFCVF